MALGYDATIRNARLDAITTAIDAGAGAGTIKIYDSTGTGRPATGADVTTQVLLATLTFTDPSFPAAAAGAMSANAITDDVAADATGTATWFRVEDSVSGHVMDGDVGTSGSDLNLNTVSLVVGATVSITQFDLTAGNA